MGFYLNKTFIVSNCISYLNNKMKSIKLALTLALALVLFDSFTEAWRRRRVCEKNLTRIYARKLVVNQQKKLRTAFVLVTNATVLVSVRLFLSAIVGIGLFRKDHLIQESSIAKRKLTNGIKI